MAAIRFRSRHLHATFFNQLTTALTTLGWIGTPVNFGADPLHMMDYQPDERSVQIHHNTVAVSLGDYGTDEDAELGAQAGGLRQADYSIFIDVYMEEQALAAALCDDIRDIYTDFSMLLVDQITGQDVPNAVIEVQEVYGPEKPGSGIEQFKRYWRTMHINATLYFQS